MEIYLFFYFFGKKNTCVKQSDQSNVFISTNEINNYPLFHESISTNI